MDCFCLQEAKRQYWEVASITFPGGETPCADWIKTNSLNQSIVLGISAFISGFNAILRIILRELSQLEGKHS